MSDEQKPTWGDSWLLQSLRSMSFPVGTFEERFKVRIEDAVQWSSPEVPGLHGDQVCTAFDYAMNTIPSVLENAWGTWKATRHDVKKLAVYWSTPHHIVMWERVKVKNEGDKNE